MRAAVRRAQLRLWRQTATKRLLQTLPYWLTLLGLWLAAVRLAVWPQDLDNGAVALLAVAGLGTLVHAFWQHWPELRVARQLDERAASHDALATALWLATQPRRDGWVEVQALHAEKVATALDITTLLPWPRVNPWGAVAATALLTASLAAPLPRPDLQGEGDAWAVAPEFPSRHKGFTTAREALGQDAAHLLTADVRLLRELEQQVDDPATRKWLGDLRQVVESVQEGRIDKRQALEQLAALEATRPPSPDDAGNPADRKSSEETDEAQRQRDVAARQAVADAVDKALDQAPEGEIKDELKKAAEKGDLGLMAKALEKLAEKDLSEKDLEKWRKTLEKFADALKDTKVPDKLKELAKKVSRLEQQRAEQGGLNPEQQRRLQEARHELEQLRKETGDAEGARHQVQRLERQARMAADELRRQQEQPGRLGKKGEQGDKGQAGQQGGQESAGKEAGGKAQKAMHEAMRQAADELRRQDNDQKARQAQRMGQERLRDVRQGLSRSGGAGDKQKGRGQEGDEGDDDGEQGEPKDGKGQKGQGKGEQGDGAGEPGQKGKKRPGSGQKGGEPGQPGQDSEGQGAGQKRGFQLGQRGLGGKSRTDLINDGYEQSRGTGKGGKEPGTGKGDDRQNGKDPGMQAARTEKVKGQQGDGPDVKKTFLETAKKGFARRGWRDVYVDYSKVAEEMVDKEGLPAGRKALVRRYFEQIRPRD